MMVASGYSSAKSIAQIPVPVPISSTLYRLSVFLLFIYGTVPTSIVFSKGARCSFPSRSSRNLWWLAKSAGRHSHQDLRKPYPISRFSFCLSSFGPLRYIKKKGSVLTGSGAQVNKLPISSVFVGMISSTIFYAILCYGRIHRESISWSAIHS